MNLTDQITEDDIRYSKENDTEIGLYVIESKLPKPKPNSTKQLDLKKLLVFTINNEQSILQALEEYPKLKSELERMTHLRDNWFNQATENGESIRKLKAQVEALQKVQHEGRLKEIMRFALQLGWVKPKWNSDYPLMQLSEVEKCMIAMNDDAYYELMKKWAIEAGLK